MHSHHSYLLRVSDFSEADISDYIKKLGYEEVSYLAFDSFGIGDSRTLVSQAFTRPEISSHKLIVVKMKNITLEAQQSLLKILETPPETSAFLFVVPQGLYLLDTVLSRFQQDILASDTANSPANTIFKLFTELSVPERINEITKKVTAKNTDWITDIKNGLLNYLSQNIRHMNQSKVAGLYSLASLIQTRGASNKYLLEELAFTWDEAVKKLENGTL